MNTDNKLSEIFDVAPIGKTEVLAPNGQVIPPRNVAIDDDYETTRNNLHTILSQGQDALYHALEVAKNSEHPRAFEVVGGLMKHLSDINGQLLDIHKKKQNIDNNSGEKSSGDKNVTNNAIFVGSTDELSKMLNDLRKGK